MICARYARLSKKGRRQDDKAASIERQLQDAERFILANHLGAVTEGTVYAEPEGTSGAAYGTRKDGVSRRPAWDAMMADAAAQKFGAVVMMTPDRGSREMFKGGAAFFELYETGCAIYFYDRGPEPLDLSDPTKKLMFTIELFGGEFYRASGKFKTTRAMQDLARNGFSTGIRIYGYRTVPTTTDPKKKLARYALVPAQAEVVRRAFEQAAAGLGDLRIATALNQDHIPGPRGTWSKEIIRNLLRSPIYKGLLIHGRTKNVDKGGNVSGHVAVPENDWIKTPMPELAIVPIELWDKVRARKAATRARYMRAADGTLLSKPEAGLLMKSLLTGFLRCGICGGSMAHMSKNNRTPRYYCVERGRRGTCSNNGGVPMRELDREVLAQLHVKLTDEDVIWDLCTERVARWRQAHARPVKERANHAQQIKRLEREISNLVGLVAKGQALPDIAKAIGERRGQVDALQRKLAEPVDIHLDRESLRAGLTMIRTFRNGDRIIDDPANPFIIYEPSRLTGPLATEHDPVGVRSALRQVGVQRIIIKPVADGWTFEGVADLGRLVNNKGMTAPPCPPRSEAPL